MKTDPTSGFDSKVESHGDGGDHNNGPSHHDGHGTGSHGPGIGCTTIEEVYDNWAGSYEVTASVGRERSFPRDMLSQFPHHGFTLDLACGTGAVGMLIHQSPLNAAFVNSNVDPPKASHQPKVYIHGVDISTKMLSSPWCALHYDSTEQGLIQDVIKNPNAAWVQYAIANEGAARPSPSLTEPLVDHITCFGALHFLNPAEFEAVLSRMFMLARRSVMFDIHDLCPTYLNHVLEKVGEGFRNYNHVAAYGKFGTPSGWTKVVEEETLIYHSPNVGVDVKGIMVRFERVD
ncbi:hypothetical protein N657DRAFT_651094 [Parathielavia appendiculata]|uniref:Methyltransferase domain-containing protein n=1 Tax=Parathielavia appendiculata TaxID=2587402 RepID=A0AAN6TQA4_9PEZI|nr:hypothetical protein N657DRAFT_651094 [Parathielavia appendiculata]